MGLLAKIILEIQTLIKLLMGHYPLPRFHFVAELDSQLIHLTEITGLAFETAVIEHRDGSSKEQNSRKLPGLIKFSNIVLKRGLVKDDMTFFNWANQVHKNQDFRRTITISLLDEEHNPVVRWKALNAWPCKYDAGTLNASSSEVVIETIELTHEGLEMIK